MRPTVYTTIFGGYDTPKPHPDIEANFVCITDDVDMVSDYWDIEVHTEYSHLSPRMQAKIFKLMTPFEGLSLFVDGSIEIVDENILDVLSEYLDRGVAMYTHPGGRDCIKQELAESMTMKKYQDQPLEQQVEHYFEEGLPEHFGLHACGVILRDGKHEGFCKEWLLENFKWTIQDQISLPYVRWKMGEIDTIPLDQYAFINDPGSELFKIISHNKDD